MNNCVAIGDASVCGSYFCTSIGQNSLAIGQGTTSVGCNASRLGLGVPNSIMSFCTYIGSNTGCDVAANYVYGTAIGAGAQISASNTVQIGRVNDTLNTSNITATNLTTTNLTGTNLTTTNLTTTNLTTTSLTSNIHTVSQQIISYNSFPVFSSQKYVGFINSALSLKTISAFNTYVNLASISIIPGVFLIQFQMNYNYSASNMLSWLNYGIGTSIGNFDIQACKAYCSSSIAAPFNISNSYIYATSSSSIVYLNAFISDFEKTYI